jgi:nitrogen-specific signal transduction histidine kinase/CheY-like chemotaxis protein
LYLRKPVENVCLVESVDRVLAAARERRKEARDAELERLSSLGVLAAGIAHEINNPLTFVVGNLELASQRLHALEAALTGVEKDELSSICTMIEKADRGAQRIAAVVRNVSAFARSDTDTLEPVDLVSILDSSMELVANEIRHHATLIREYGKLPRVLGSPAKLGQVFVNLLTNAAHAVRDAGGAAHHEISVVAHETPEGHVMVAISDTGRGIPPPVMARIFDPFFSTKPIGVGTGLGLAISHRLVTDMGGAIDVQSVVGRGTTFRVTFPSSAQGTESARRAEAKLAQPGSSPKPRLLVIDDEAMVCDLLVTVFGGDYQVEALASPREGLARILAGQHYDVILCDLMMAELSGMELHDKLARARPDQADRMIFMTGGTFTSRASKFLDRLPGGYVQKPFVGSELQDAVAAFLRRHGPVGNGQRRAN